ncbi:hypothetical protein CCR85_08895 [Rhodothalassium salexigens]|uniref:methyltransferase family protein n=1 Tax=Rhodothalassium salexigens TaxID=1086 RepID=UPI00191186C3|nr:methyltransferase [Rhodothalassium salexigens]MBK5911604.1 hypothetical protein [Rhodothalassium salexigens]
MRWLIPPVLWFLCAGLIFGLARLAPAWGLPDPALAPGASARTMLVAGLALIALAGLLKLLAAYEFHRARTTIHPFHDPDHLITRGVFARSRNPIYLGLVISLAGVAVIANTAWGLAVVALFWLVCDRWYVAVEEDAARRRFPADFDAYCARVRRWI